MDNHCFKNYRPKSQKIYLSSGHWKSSSIFSSTFSFQFPHLNHLFLQLCMHPQKDPHPVASCPCSFLCMLLSPGFSLAMTCWVITAAAHVHEFSDLWQPSFGRNWTNGLFRTLFQKRNTNKIKELFSIRTIPKSWHIELRWNFISYRQEKHFISFNNVIAKQLSQS